ELDCTLTKDGKVVVIHDDTLKRTAGIDKRVDALTLAELKELDAGSWRGSRFAGEPLPTLDQSLAFAKGNLGVYIEIKNCADDRELIDLLGEHSKTLEHGDDALLAELMAAIEASGTQNLELTRKTIKSVRSHRMARQVVIQSFSPIVCAVTAAEAPDLRVEFLGGEDKDHPGSWERFLAYGNLIGVDGFNPNKESLTPERIADLHAKGKSIAVWTVDDPADMKRLADWGVDSIITNKPDLALEILGRKLQQFP
ncbi:MAG: glycerophosphodiester phosphodiesterase family protein, partial [Candidatus Hydrogenedentales bacterium]